MTVIVQNIAWRVSRLALFPGAALKTYLRELVFHASTPPPTTGEVNNLAIDLDLDFVMARKTFPTKSTVLPQFQVLV